MATSDEAKDDYHRDSLALLETIRKHILECLDNAVPNECIQLCGLSALTIIAQRPEDVLEKAKEQLHAFPYANVPTHWRRLYEDASLHIAAKLLQERISQMQKPPVPTAFSTINPAKRQKLELGIPSIGDWLEEFCKVMDRAVIISGAPGRKTLIDDVLKELEFFVIPEWASKDTRRLPTPRPCELDTDNHIMRTPAAWDLEEFQLHLETSGGPVILPGTFSTWPAMNLWDDVHYLKFKTLGGNRIVPVEIGSSYNEDNWSQKIMNFAEFVERYLIPDQPHRIGYLAQHDLFEQIPSLRNDIRIPDYCYTTPPDPKGAAAQTAGLNTVRQLDTPLLNAWLGPAGTKTPLHTDPYHNILCQVVGYKYVRLYNPEYTKYMYPSGFDAAGINMNNTSKVDLFHWRPTLKSGEIQDEAAFREQVQNFPDFGKAEFQEAILGPGDCLYIPLGWWHYVESMTASFSVSFWWN